MTGRELRDWRLRNNLTQDQLFEKSGVPQATIARIESKEKDSISKVETLNKLTQALKDHETVINPTPGLGEEFHDPNYDHTDKRKTVNRLKELMKVLENPTTPAPQIVKESLGIPMYNFPGSATNVEMYQDESVQIVGYLKIPGAVKNSFCLPVRGDSMYPTLVNGNWCVLRDDDRNDIEWGQIYYVEYGNHRVYKRLLYNPDDTETVILWSDNQTTMINDRPIYSPKIIKIDRIRRISIVTDILQKPNY